MDKEGPLSQIVGAVARLIDRLDQESVVLIVGFILLGAAALCAGPGWW